MPEPSWGMLNRKSLCSCLGAMPVLHPSEIQEADIPRASQTCRDLEHARRCQQKKLTQQGRGN